MIKKENRKIIYEAISMVVILLILITNVQASQEQKEDIIFNDKAPPNRYLVFGYGFIGDMTINGDDYKIGILKGCLSIYNGPGWNAPRGYKLYIFDVFSFKLYTKDSLPTLFTLENFNGIGYINYINIPHGFDATKFLIIGKAVNFT
jgi:hypothetical protein